jgi:hypothetical protein
MQVSFIIITDGNKPRKTYQQVNSILKQNIPIYEIVICGDIEKLNLPSHLLRPNIKLVCDKENAKRGSLGGLRNNACKNSAYDNLVISDDDMLFPSDWFQNLTSSAFDYEIMTTCIKNPDGTRFWDNACYLSPTKGHINLNYNENDDCLYMSGGQAWLIKKHIWEKVKWDESILIYTMKSVTDYAKGMHNEDTDFALRCREAGFNIKHNKNVVVYHNDISYTSIGRVIRRRSFMPNYNWVRELKFPEGLLIPFANHLLQSNVIEGIDILRKLACNGSINAVHLISKYEEAFGGPLENSSFSFENTDYHNIIKSTDSYE